ncbi:SIS domain-containing protein [Carboxydochorda subterranea]|uniref:SIS domain-containing protein n=1 Tax=Carboxydichorda subterranea TaxID=3109565 RepID=A0ABZ1BZD6_9FIRM|nr:SIS domain-containing protein [Limnochorda sp. L945t]WRP17437.1 SIS domain-containing protein [Limnochorda sp. L945t]
MPLRRDEPPAAAGTAGAAEAYWNAMARLWQEIQAAEAASVEGAAQKVAEAIAGGATLWAFGATHSSLLTGELVYRAGGLAIINPIYAPGLTISERPLPRTSTLEHLPGYAKVVLSGVPLRQGDVLFVFSTSGRNAVPVEMAMTARSRGATVIAFTSRRYALVAPPDHPPGHYLHDVADIVIDTHVPAGDAALRLNAVDAPVGPASTVVGALLVNGLMCRVAELLARRGLQPPVFTSGNVPGGAEANRRLLEALKGRIHYT